MLAFACTRLVSGNRLAHITTEELVRGCVASEYSIRADANRVAFEEVRLFRYILISRNIVSFGRSKDSLAESSYDVDQHSISHMSQSSTIILCASSYRKLLLILASAQSSKPSRGYYTSEDVINVHWVEVVKENMLGSFALLLQFRTFPNSLLGGLYMDMRLYARSHSSISGCHSVYLVWTTRG